VSRLRRALFWRSDARLICGQDSPPPKYGSPFSNPLKRLFAMTIQQSLTALERHLFTHLNQPWSRCHFKREDAAAQLLMQLTPTTSISIPSRASPLSAQRNVDCETAKLWKPRNPETSRSDELSGDPPGGNRD
jgi:hypothetical protein